MRAWIPFQTEKVPGHLFSDMRIELADLSLSSGTDLNAVSQDSVSQFPHEFPERDGPFLFHLFQGGVGVFEVQTVHFLKGQALQEPEILNRDNGGQVFPPARHNRSFLPVGGTVYDFGKLFPSFRNIQA